MVYANVPQEQFSEVTRQLPIAVNSEGMPVSIGADQKAATPKSVSLDDDHRLEDINLRNANGRLNLSILGTFCRTATQNKNNKKQTMQKCNRQTIVLFHNQCLLDELLSSANKAPSPQN